MIENPEKNQCRIRGFLQRTSTLCLFVGETDVKEKKIGSWGLWVEGLEGVEVSLDPPPEDIKRVH